AAVTAAAATRAGAAAAAPPDATALAVAAALAPLPGYARDASVRLDAVAGWRPSAAAGGAAGAFWVVGEFGADAPSPSSVDVTVIDAGGATVARASVAGGRSVVVPVTTTGSIAPGDYTIRVRAEGSSASSVTVKLPPAPESGGALFFRRGPTTAMRAVPTADRRFRRSEQLRVDVPATSSAAPNARLLDRTGKPLAVPVTAAAREDADGSRWHTAQLALAPLAAGDYIVELTSAGEAGDGGGVKSERRLLVGFRVVP